MTYSELLSDVIQRRRVVLHQRHRRRRRRRAGRQRRRRRDVIVDVVSVELSGVELAHVGRGGERRVLDALERWTVEGLVCAARTEKQQKHHTLVRAQAAGIKYKVHVQIHKNLDKHWCNLRFLM